MNSLRLIIFHVTNVEKMLNTNMASSTASNVVINYACHVVMTNMDTRKYKAFKKP